MPSCSRSSPWLAGVFGFVALSGTLALIAKILLFVFVVLFVLSLVFGGGGVRLSDPRRAGKPTVGPPGRQRFVAAGERNP